MRNRFKRLITAAFAVAVFFCVSPAAHASDVPTSGRCGTNITWEFTADNELIISGTGSINNYTAVKPAPWNRLKSKVVKITITGDIYSIGSMTFSSCKNATEVTIPSTVSNIGKKAFSGCKKLKEITLPEKLTTIGDMAFANCTALKEITIPDRVAQINEGAFSGCKSITSLTLGDRVSIIQEAAFENCVRLEELKLPESLKEIGDYAFFGLSSIKTVTIPAGCWFIGDEAFADCHSLVEINVDPGNRVYSSIDGVLFNKNGDTLFCFPSGRAGSYTVPDGTRTIGDFAFYICPNLTEVDCNGAAYIGSWDFYDCPKLKSVSLGANFCSYGSMFLGHCPKLETVTVAEGNRYYKSVDGILYNSSGAKIAP